MQNMNILISVLAFSLTSTNAARADFGRAGTKAIDGNLDLAIGKSTETAPSGEEESSSIAAANVGGSYFVTDSVSVGARVVLAYQAEEDVQSMTAVGLLLAGGYAHRLGERFHVWPQAGLGLTRSTITLGDWSASMVELGLQIQVPFYVQPAEHLMVGLGPVLAADLAGTFSTEDGDEELSKTTEFGLVGSVVGWW